MKKFVCSVCGYVYEGESAPAACPLCGAPADKFVEQKEENLAWADQHVVGVAQGVVSADYVFILEKGNCHVVNNKDNSGIERTW